MIFRYLPVLLLGGFLLEIASIIWVGQFAGVLATLVLLMAGGVIGMGLFRSAGTNVALVLRSSLQTPDLQRQLAGATMMRVMAGILFLVPGFFSDAVALLLLLPPFQSWFASRIRFLDLGTGGGETSPYERTRRPAIQVIEGEAVVIEEESTDESAGEHRRPSS